jgi:putative thioredoxin
MEKTPKPILVLFKMDTCPYCQPLLKPATTPLSTFGGRVALKVADASSDRAVAELFGVRSYPTILLVTPEDRVHRYEGKRDRTSIEAWVSKLVSA